MDIKGKVITVLEIEKGQSKKGGWQKQTFVVETAGQYPKKIALSAWNDKVTQFNLSVGDEVEVGVDLESREYNGKWYTEARAWRLKKNGEESTNTDSSVDDLPW